jgi:multicomponent Na+:H+ antiporter subunit D
MAVAGFDTSAAMIQSAVPLAEALIIVPVILPLLAAVVGVMMRGRPNYIRALAVLVALGLFGASAGLLFLVMTSGPFAVTMGQWLPPFGITLVADNLSAILVFASAFAGLAIILYATADVSEAEIKAGFYSLLFGILAGVNGAFITGDIFNLYVWFEVFLISSFGLIVLGGERLQLDGALKYSVLNLVATTMFLIAVALIYGATGTLNMADLSQKLANTPGNDTLMLIIGLLFLMGFGMKAAAFPTHFWLPASYHTPKPLVSALFAGLLTKVGVYALMRTFTTIMPGAGTSVLFDIIFALAVGTIVVGLFGALSESNVRRMLGYLLIAGIGVMLVGLALRTQLALTASIFYMVHSIITLVGLYLASGIIERRIGQSSLHDLGGFYTSAPVLAGSFLLLGFSAAGIPPLSGFWPKVFLIQDALEVGAVLAVVALVFNGVLSLIIIGRVWSLLFWRPDPLSIGRAAPLSAAPRDDAATDGPVPTHDTTLVWSVAVLGLATLALGVWPEPLLRIADTAAAGLLDPAAYVRAVFGEVTP